MVSRAAAPVPAVLRARRSGRQRRPVEREATGHRAARPARGPRLRRRRAPADAPGPGGRGGLAGVARPSSIAVSRLSDGPAPTSTMPPGDRPASGLPRSPAAGPAGSPPATGRALRLGNSQPVERIPSRCGERGTVGRPPPDQSLRSAAPILPTVGARPLRPAVTRSPAAPVRSSPAAGGGPVRPVRRPRPRCPSPHAGTAATRCRPRSPRSPRPPAPSPVCRSSSPIGAAAVRASMHQAANGARETCPAAPTAAASPAWSSGGFPGASLAARSVHRRRRGPRR